MKKILSGLFSFCIFSFVFSVSSAAQKLPASTSLRVVIIRHGEKPANGDNLSCQGLNRALALPPVLDSVLGVPNYTYVPTIQTGKSTSSVRMFQTVTPFAVQYNLTINSKYAETDTVKVAADVIKKTGVVLMVWEHHNIPGIARNLGVKGNLSWSGTDFDSIWIIDFATGNSTPTLTISQENIFPSASCPD
jgi:hypothetical protein